MLFGIFTFHTFLYKSGTHLFIRYYVNTISFISFFKQSHKMKKPNYFAHKSAFSTLSKFPEMYCYLYSTY